MSVAKHLIRIMSALAVALFMWGCSSTANDGAVKFNPAAGAHPDNWLTTHYAEFIKNPEQCRTCHGSTTDKNLAGGTSGVSCFGCHHPNGPSHQAGWDNHMQHGRNGAQLAAGDTSGFAYCAKCHGSNYNNPIGTSPSCTSCHTKAPHPDKPWNGATADKSNHTFTGISNAAECAKCHTNGANSTLRPSTPAPAGTAPGCFNNTLCHGTHI